MNKLPLAHYILLLFLVFAAAGCGNQNATQRYIDQANAHVHLGMERANAAWTVAGANKEMLEALDRALAVDVPLFADANAVATHQRFLLEAHSWFSVRPNWKTNVAYGGLGATAGVIDFFGGSGLALTAVAGTATWDMNQRKKKYERMQAALEEWRRFCGENGYQPGL